MKTIFRGSIPPFAFGFRYYDSQFFYRYLYIKNTISCCDEHYNLQSEYSYGKNIQIKWCFKERSDSFRSEHLFSELCSFFVLT